jgi:hypothetical protein
VVVVGGAEAEAGEEAPGREVVLLDLEVEVVGGDGLEEGGGDAAAAGFGVGGQAEDAGPGRLDDHQGDAERAGVAGGGEEAGAGRMRARTWLAVASASGRASTAVQVASHRGVTASVTDTSMIGAGGRPARTPSSGAVDTTVGAWRR